jgi:hypothetical protein
MPARIAKACRIKAHWIECRIIVRRGQPLPMPRSTRPPFDTHRGDTYDCRYKLRQCVLASKYNGVDESQFGSLKILVSKGKTHHVCDLHYGLGDGRFGMRLIPVNDEGAVIDIDGAYVPGSAVVDDLLRARMGLSEHEPIYALASYIRAEEHRVAIQDLPGSMKLFFGHKHLAAYLGEGRTTHSPEKHHAEAWRRMGHNIWNVRGYPATLFTVSLEGIDQATLNRNGRIADAILNAGALAPSDFERMRCRVFDLNTILQFYRDWIRQAEYLTGLSWFMSCADHKMIVVNVMLSVPHNPRKFLEIFGNDGHQLWADFRQRFRQLTGHDFKIMDETDFEPLWQKEGLSTNQIRPLSLSQYNAFHAAVVENRLQQYDGPRPLPPGVGLAWPTETVVDLVAGFVSTYLRFDEVGGVLSSVVIMRLAAQFQKRLNIPETEYYKMVVPVVSKLLVADAMVHARKGADWLANAKDEFHRALLEGANDSDEDCSDRRISRLLRQIFEEAESRLPMLAQAKSVDRSTPIQWLDNELVEIVKSLREHAMSGRMAAQFFTTPAVFHRIALGVYPRSRFVTVTPVCTVMDQSELELAQPPDEAIAYVNAVHGRTGQTANRTDQEYRAQGANGCLNRVGGNEIRRVGPEGAAEHYPSSFQEGFVQPSTCSACRGERQLVYAVGRLGYDFGTDACLDTFRQRMRQLDRPDRGKERQDAGQKLQAIPQDEKQLLAFLIEMRGLGEPWHAASLLWTLNVDGMPLYVVRPEGPFARESYGRLLEFLNDQFRHRAERIAVPGIVTGHATLLNGQRVPVINPDLLGLCNWSTDALIDAVLCTSPEADDPEHEKKVRAVLRRFLDRLCYELRNPGRLAPERALNYAGTNLFEFKPILSTLDTATALDRIHVERSTNGRPRSDCWDITLSFFDPDQPLQTIRKIYRYTIDVSDVIPVTVGEIRSWVVR